jgi:hypothetical protein
MPQQPVPPHLPKPLRDPATYRRLYAFKSRVDDILDGHLDDEWREIRIPSGLPAADVYRLLPTAEGFEYGGYLTKARIRYLACGPTEAQSLQAKPCTFHTHPTSYEGADTPSFHDIYSFLAWRHLRAITVGAHWIWVWEKDRQVLKTVRRLAEWESKHMIDEVGRLAKTGPAPFVDRYFPIVLKQLGLRWTSRSFDNPARWSALLCDSLGIKTSLIRRQSDR